MPAQVRRKPLSEHAVGKVAAESEHIREVHRARVYERFDSYLQGLI
jgi:hypothetical protein